MPDSLSRAYVAFHKRDRVIPDYRFYETHSGARETALWVAEFHEDIEIFIYENTYDVGNTDEDELAYVQIDFSDRKNMIDFLKDIQYTKEKIQEMLINSFGL